MTITDERFAARMLELADELFDRYPELPVMTILTVLNTTRRELSDADGHPPSPSRLAAVVSERLAEAARRRPVRF